MKIIIIVKLLNCMKCWVCVEFKVEIISRNNCVEFLRSYEIFQTFWTISVYNFWLFFGRFRWSHRRLVVVHFMNCLLLLLVSRNMKWRSLTMICCSCHVIRCSFSDNWHTIYTVACYTPYTLLLPSPR